MFKGNLATIPIHIGNQALKALIGHDQTKNCTITIGDLELQISMLFAASTSSKIYAKLIGNGHLNANSDNKNGLSKEFNFNFQYPDTKEINFNFQYPETKEIITAYFTHGGYSGDINYQTSFELYKVGELIGNDDFKMQFEKNVDENNAFLYCSTGYKSTEIDVRKNSINFLASNFYKIPHDELIEIFKTVDPNYIEETLQNENFTVSKSEDEIATLILETLEILKDSKNIASYQRLLNHIYADNCSGKVLESLIDYICSDAVDPDAQLAFIGLLQSIKYAKNPRKYPRKTNNHFADDALDDIEGMTIEEVTALFKELLNNNDENAIKVIKERKLYDFEKGGKVLIFEAARNNDVEFCKKLQKLGAKVSNSNYNICHMFCYNGNLEGVKAFATDANINQQTADEKRTVLHIAAHKNNYEIVKFLVDNFKNINLKLRDSLNRTPAQLSTDQKIQRLLNPVSAIDNQMMNY